MSLILGLSLHHDAGAALIDAGEVVAAADEERFSRQKHDGSYPFGSISFCLDEAGVDAGGIDAIAVPTEGDLAKLARFVGSFEPEVVSQEPIGRETEFRQLADRTRRLADRPTDLAHRAVTKAFGALGVDGDGAAVPAYLCDLSFPEGVPVHKVNHHEAHAASAYYASGHDESLVVTADGIGNAFSTTVWDCRDGEMEALRRWGRRGSLGWFFGIVTQALGWWIGNGEGKTMGLASYGSYDETIAGGLRQILPRYEDGDLADGVDFSEPDSFDLRGTHHWTFDEATVVEDLLDRHDRSDVAATAQRLLEEQILAIVRPWMERKDHDLLATAGGVFLNVRVNNRVLRDIDPESYFVFPNAGDGGLALGSALSAWRHEDRSFTPFELEHVYLGPSIDSSVGSALTDRKLTHEQPDDIVESAADMLADGAIVAWCQGRMEYGPRALGNRSILIDPTLEDGMDRVNRSVKFRESWRPFAPSLKESAANEYLVDPVYDPFMITSFDVRPEKRDEIPAVTHVDGTTRPQLVRRSVNERYWELLDAFEDRTGTPVLLNTSFNLSGDPIVRGPADAIETFYGCGLDALVLGDRLITK